MATRRTFLGWLAILGASIIAVLGRFIPAFWRARPLPPSGGRAMLVTQDNYAEAFAELADPNDPDSIRVLVDSVLQHDNSYFPPMPEEVEENIRSKLVQAEVAYRIGSGPGVREQDLAETCNFIVARLGLPEAALTSQLQVHLLRTQSSLSSPRLMQVGRADETSSSAMSPLQAAIVAKSLLISKRGLTWYWVPPTEWNATRYEEGMRTLRGVRESVDKLGDENLQKTNILKAQLANSKSREAVSTWFRRTMGIPYYPLPVFSSLDSTGQMKLINEAFTQLGFG